MLTDKFYVYLHVSLFWFRVLLITEHLKKYRNFLLIYHHSSPISVASASKSGTCQLVEWTKENIKKLRRQLPASHKSTQNG